MAAFNCQLNTTVPFASEFFSRITAKYAIVIAISTLITLANLVLYLIHMIRICLRVSSTTRRVSIGYLSGTPAFVSITCLVALYVPRLHFYASMLSFLYFIGAFYGATQIFWITIGTREAVANELRKDSQKFKLNTPPCCCCLRCLPEAEMTARNIRRIERLALLAIVVRFIETMIFLALYFEHGILAFKYSQYIDLAWLPFFFLGMYGCHLLAVNMAKMEKVQKSNCIRYFKLTDLFMLFYGIQHPIFVALTNAGKFKCDILPMNNTGYFWKNTALVVLSFLLTIIMLLIIDPARESAIPNDFESISTEISMRSRKQSIGK
ncbi:unnamed protein product [Bursaphelenchus xylophilus]|uniref:(pine wood nematode) hypothetical protein n=1 Tax=Bursaphelenchus xylophilus TaxID=6326 RepID=A0A1I7RXU8_BURXY|nr:unnamed protein product [Bursaphelenchus xylophilus]CAG9125179.1 unnamed protein product [Bursaphelenchus xylophilus]